MRDKKTKKKKKKRKKEEGSEKGGWKFTHFTSPGSAPGKNIFTLVTLPNFSLLGVISAEKMSVENLKNYRRLYDWGYALYP